MRFPLERYAVGGPTRMTRWNVQTPFSKERSRVLHETPGDRGHCNAAGPAPMTADPTAAGAAEATGAAGASRGARNFRLGVLNGALNGALYQAGEGFMDSNTVIPLFVSRLTASN